MISIFILGFLVLASEGRPQNDGLIHTDLIPERRQDLPELPNELIDMLMNKTNRQNDGLIHKDLIPERKQTESRAANSCGCAVPSSSGRIVGGSEVNPKYKYPYQALFLANGYMCGGTIINKRYVLTAMHCLYDPSGKNEHPVSNTSVVIGEHKLSDNVNEGGQLISVDSFIKRSDYDPKTMASDIALLKLKSDIKFTANVKPACLPTDSTKTYEGQSGIVTGWGDTVGFAVGEKAVQQKPSDDLKVTTVKILGSSDCSKVTRGDSSTQMCAFASETDACQGDSGGPMTVVENGKYTVVGVVSYGYGCASKDPGVYARVTNYLSWINTNAKSGDCASGPTGGSTGGSTSACSYKDQISQCSDYKKMCDSEYVSGVCPKTCKC